MEFVLFLREPPDVVSKAFPALLDTSLEVPRAPRAFVCALKITHKGLLEVGPIMDSVARQVLELYPRPPP
jgi:hypothetical protein